MPQSPQRRPLVQSISLEYSYKVFHQTPRTKHFPGTLTQVTSLEHRGFHSNEDLYCGFQGYDAV
jgi:hypothetical protein